MEVMCPACWTKQPVMYGLVVIHNKREKKSNQETRCEGSQLCVKNGVKTDVDVEPGKMVNVGDGWRMSPVDCPV
jgi:hypothetical protein